MRTWTYRGNKNQLTSTDKRMKILRTFFVAFAIIIIFRLFKIQILDHGFYTALAFGQHEIYRDLLPQRGEIFVREKDDSLFPVAINKDLTLVWADVRNIDSPTRAAKVLSEILGLDELELKAKLSRSDDPYEPIIRGATEEQREWIASSELPGINFTPVASRAYPELGFGGHVLGFLGSNAEGEMSGRYGLEGYYDEDLRGAQGFLSGERDAAGRLIAVARRSMTPAEDGSDIVLTIDRTIQFFVCEKLKAVVDRFRAEGGSVVVLDPKTGRVVAMCGLSDFDPNSFASVEDISSFNNPAIFKDYEPGSVFKPITMAAALDMSKVGPETTYNDDGAVEIPPHTIRNSDNKANGVQTMTQVLEKSLNTGVIFAMRQIGARNFKSYVERFGFGASTGIDLQSEAHGDISSLRESGEIYAATASFGQGITVTPIQLVAAFGAIANGGKLMKPYVVDEIIHPNGEHEKQNPVMVRQVISARTATLLEAMLVSVVERGHGRRAGVPGYWIGGKTGTAQIPRKDGPGYEEGANIGSFAGFGPVPDPVFAMIVRIDRPHDVEWAESSAAPLFGEIARFLLQYYQVPATRPVGPVAKCHFDCNFHLSVKIVSKSFRLIYD